MRGHSTRFQRRIACSSRSNARPLGRWQLQLSWRRIRHTCRGVVLHAVLLLDELAHPRQRPQSGCISHRLRAAFERALNLSLCRVNYFCRSRQLFLPVGTKVN